MSTPDPSRAIQPQWDLSHTAFKTAQAFRDLVANASKDDASGQAMLACEQLGSSLLLRKELMAKCYDALCDGKYKVLWLAKLVVGLPGDGIAKEFRKSPGCIACLVFIAACRMRYTNEVVGNILFEAMDVQGVLKRIPCSPKQLVQVIDMVAGYCEQIYPVDLYHDFLEKLITGGRAGSRRGTQEPSSPSHMEPSLLMSGARGQDGSVGSLLDPMQAASISEIMIAVFDAVKDIENHRITLKGSRDGVWIATLCTWMLPIEVGVIDPSGKRIYGVKSPRLDICLQTSRESSWELLQWKVAGDISAVFDLDQHAAGYPMRNLRARTSPTMYPLKSTCMLLKGRFSLSEDATLHIGCLAGALVELLLDRGRFDLTYGHTGDEDGLSLFGICQQDFVAGYRRSLSRYGWNIDKDFLNVQDHLKTKISLFLGDAEAMKAINKERQVPGSSGLAFISKIALKEFWDNAGHDASIMTPYAAIVACCVLRATCVANLPEISPQLSYGYADKLLAEKLISDFLLNSMLDNFEPMILSNFLLYIMKNSLPGIVEISNATLACTSNGYIAYFKVLERPTSNRREACEIVVAPGSIRWGATSSPFRNLEEYETKLVESAEGFENLIYDSNGARIVQPFSSGCYAGLKVPWKSDDLPFETTVAVSGDSLISATYLRNRSPDHEMQRIRWISCITAVVQASRVIGPSISAATELKLAEEFHRQGTFMSTVWLQLDASVVPAMTGGITCTLEDEVARFFASGIFIKRAELVVIKEEDAALIQCISQCVQLQKRHVSNGRRGYWIVIS